MSSIEENYKQEALSTRLNLYHDIPVYTSGTKLHYGDMHVPVLRAIPLSLKGSKW